MIGFTPHRRLPGVVVAGALLAGCGGAPAPESGPIGPPSYDLEEVGEMIAGFGTGIGIESNLVAQDSLEVLFESVPVGIRAREDGGIRIRLALPVNSRVSEEDRTEFLARVREYVPDLVFEMDKDRFTMVRQLGPREAQTDQEVVGAFVQFMGGLFQVVILGGEAVLDL